MQTAFTSALFAPDARLPEGLVTPDGRPASKRFNVYRNNVISSLIEALGAAYPVVKKLVGDEFFTAMAGVYVRACPPKSPLMILYGGEFPAFLDDFEPARSVPYLSDVSRLERARREAWHAADDPVADPAILSDLSAESLMEVRFVLHASLRLVSSPYPVASIWQANTTEPNAALDKTAQDVLIARPRDNVLMNILPAGGHAFLSALSRGQTLGQATERAGAAHQDFDLSQNLAGLFATELSSQILIT